MSNSLCFKDQFVNQNLNYLPIDFTHNPSIDLLEQYADALNENGHLPYTVNLETLLEVEYLQIAQSYQGDFIAGSTLKHFDGELAETGFMLVKTNYRRLGLAETMTKSRISYAQQLGARLLYTKVREKNITRIISSKRGLNRQVTT